MIYFNQGCLYLERSSAEAWRGPAASVGSQSTQTTPWQWGRCWHHLSKDSCISGHAWVPIHHQANTAPDPHWPGPSPRWWAQWVLTSKVTERPWASSSGPPTLWSDGHPFIPTRIITLWGGWQDHLGKWLPGREAATETTPAAFCLPSFPPSHHSRKHLQRTGGIGQSFLFLNSLLYATIKTTVMSDHSESW